MHESFGYIDRVNLENECMINTHSLNVCLLCCLLTQIEIVADLALMAESRDIPFDAVRCKETMAALEVTSGSPLLHCSRTTFCRLLEAAGTSPNGAIVLYTAWRRRVDGDRKTTLSEMTVSEFIDVLVVDIGAVLEEKAVDIDLEAVRRVLVKEEVDFRIW